MLCYKSCRVMSYEIMISQKYQIVEYKSLYNPSWIGYVWLMSSYGKNIFLCEKLKCHFQSDYRFFFQFWKTCRQLFANIVFIWFIWSKILSSLQNKYKEINHLGWMHCISERSLYLSLLAATEIYAYILYGIQHEVTDY